MTGKVCKDSMRITKSLALVTFLSFGLASTPANAAVIELFDWGLNIDGNITFLGDPLPAGVDATGFDFGSGLGMIDISISGAGPHNATGFFDIEIDESINTFFNETGATGGGSAAAGQFWEIDEPGFLFGDIFDNFLSNTLDNTNAFGPPDDVSMAMGFDFTLDALETATVSFFLDIVNDAPGFFLEQFDPDSDGSVFFWSSLTITGGIPPDPTPLVEPSTFLLVSAGLLGLGLRRRSLRSH